MKVAASENDYYYNPTIITTLQKLQNLAVHRVVK